jgi:hydroxymethylglutaryl-CoA lyase
MAEKAYVREVGLRDGLQMVSGILPTERKLEWIRGSVAAGLNQMEITSFVPPKLLPQFADAEVLVRESADLPGLKAAALVPNLKGAERALELGVAKIHYTLSASETHNMKNVRRPTQESLADFARIAQRRAEMQVPPGSRSILGCGVSTAFGCTMEGEIRQSDVLRIVAALLESGAEEIVVADTVGYATPGQVKSLMRAVVREAAAVPVAGHFHDTRGMALANIVAALEAGVRAFDSSLGGLGGCPFAPNATGNVDTEDTVYLLESMGFDTGVDLQAIIALRTQVEGWMPGEKFSGAVARAGIAKTYRRAATTEID